VRRRIAIAVAAMLTAGLSGVLSGEFAGRGAAQAQETCTRPDFEAVVETAAASLRDLNARNAPNFQDKLRLLRERQKWSADEFMARAAVYVQDERIAAYDQRANELLERINSMGEAGAAKPDCKLLAELRATMKTLVDTQIEKWAYMFAKIERGLVN
jgi:hypothetical protein